MFLDFYKLREQPFGVTPDPKFLYLSPTHREALASLIYALECDRGFMALIAPPGMGKTTLLFSLLQQFQASARTAFLFHTQCTPLDFLRQLVNDLGIQDCGRDTVKMQLQLGEVLACEAKEGRRVIVVIDEAQDLSDEVLESVRLLSNFETPSVKLLQIVLAGQPPLAKRLAQPQLAQLRQRISVAAHLDPFSPLQTGRYIEHRLAVAGHPGGDLFTPEARALISAVSGGIPRNINNLCFNALSLGFAMHSREIDGSVIREVADDLDMAVSGEGELPSSLPDLSPQEVPLAPEPERAGTSKGLRWLLRTVSKNLRVVQPRFKPWVLHAAVLCALLGMLTRALLSHAGNRVWVNRSTVPGYASDSLAPYSNASGVENLHHDSNSIATDRGQRLWISPSQHEVDSTHDSAPHTLHQKASSQELTTHRFPSVVGRPRPAALSSNVLSASSRPSGAETQPVASVEVPKETRLPFSNSSKSAPVLGRSKTPMPGKTLGRVKRDDLRDPQLDKADTRSDAPKAIYRIDMSLRTSSPGPSEFSSASALLAMRLHSGSDALPKQVHAGRVETSGSCCPFKPGDRLLRRSGQSELAIDCKERVANEEGVGVPSCRPYQFNQPARKPGADVQQGSVPLLLDW